ncbi:aldose epimerase [Demequina sp.]|uniref:aldose epimerase family protein n=1 Tax=Demequina sp. TaxID=2050685 RepID=UPI0025DF0CD0|nr:aldose epimerase [Demequina sp.]
MPEIITIENPYWKVGLLPSTGGSVAFGQVRLEDEWADVLRPTTAANLATASRTASYPLVPWSNRIREGRLRWDGTEYALRVNWPDGTAIHGTGWEYPWAVVERSDDRAVLELDSRDYFGMNWPWAFVARFTYALDGDRFVWTYGVENVDQEAFPAGFGHHPYFLRSVAGSAEAELEVRCAHGYALAQQMPTEGAGEIPAHANFTTRRPVGQTFVDDCFTGRTGETLAAIEYPGTLGLEITADSLLSHAVLYIPPGKDFFAFEPVSNANDAFTLAANGVEGTGLFTVEPGQAVEASFAIAATPLR